jgi:uncharacterized protein YkwD
VKETARRINRWKSVPSWHPSLCGISIHREGETSYWRESDGKDLGDISRLMESHPELWGDLPPDLQTRPPRPGEPNPPMLNPGNPMEIKCPVCSTPIEITEEHIGQKGRCPGCESKFIIPENPDEEFQILHRCEVPDEVPKHKVELVRSPRDPSNRRRMPVRLRSKESRSPVVLIAVMICAAVLMGFFFLRNKDGDAQAAHPSPELETESPPSVPPSNLQERPAPGPVKPTPAPGAVPEVAETREPAEPTPTPEPEVVGEVTTPVEDLPPALTDEQKSNALTFLKSSQESKRKAAYAGFRKLGDREKPSYLKLLALARDHHASALCDSARDLVTRDRDLSSFQEVNDSWISARDEAKQMVQTNWKDQDPGHYKKKHAEMDDISEETFKLFKRLVRSAKQAAKVDSTGLQQYADALAEIRGEIAWCDDDEPDEAMTLLEEISEAGSADDYVKLINLADEVNQIATALDAAEEHNADCAWAGDAYKDFATTLNGRRAALGLGVLRLDEQLSNACGDHSADMAANGYFSHTGLTPETKTFGDRARRAKFSGFATGECIFMGNSSASAAHQAWWYSDGHRLIMYASNPNTLGLGLHGKHWTLNTGKK